jgi:hypothetical protein
LLSLPARGNEQDWEIELGTLEIIPQVLDLIEAGTMNLEERSALWLLLMGSLEDAIGQRDILRQSMTRAAPLLKMDPEVRDRMRFHWLEGGHALYPGLARILVNG